jgi:hypothetical protein
LISGLSALLSVCVLYWFWKLVPCCPVIVLVVLVVLVVVIVVIVVVVVVLVVVVVVTIAAIHQELFCKAFLCLQVFGCRARAASSKRGAVHGLSTRFVGPTAQ